MFRGTGDSCWDARDARFEFNIWYSRNAVLRSDTEEVMLGGGFLHIIFFFIS